MRMLTPLLDNGVKMTSKRCGFILSMFIVKCISKCSLIRIISLLRNLSNSRPQYNITIWGNKSSATNLSCIFRCFIVNKSKPSWTATLHYSNNIVKILAITCMKACHTKYMLIKLLIATQLCSVRNPQIWFILLLFLLTDRQWWNCSWNWKLFFDFGVKFPKL